MHLIPVIEEDSCLTPAAVAGDHVKVSVGTVHTGLCTHPSDVVTQLLLAGAVLASACMHRMHAFVATRLRRAAGALIYAYKVHGHFGLRPVLHQPTALASSYAPTMQAPPHLTGRLARSVARCVVGT